jgi:glycosyltransferase involved in cell wall biosynthesis
MIKTPLARPVEMKIMFIDPYPTEGASSRYRVEQYVPYLSENGFRCSVRPFISPRFYRILYKRGFYLKKAAFFIESCIRRFFDLFTALSSDLVFIHLEAFPFGPPIFETILSLAGKKMIYDFDDAIFMRSASNANSFMRYFKCPSKVNTILRISDYVITSNNYLCGYAKRYNDRVEVINTSVDTDKFIPSEKQTGDTARLPTIGWIGSYTTSPYLEMLRDVFARLSEKYRFRIKLVGAQCVGFDVTGVEVESTAWRLKDEIEQFRSLDIGVYPLPENDWTLGKAGFKAIQYMSVAVPCVASRVGTNNDIIEDGVDGFLVKTADEWVDRLSRLMESPELRKRMGDAGRKKIENACSLKVNAPRVLTIIRGVIDGGRGVFETGKPDA